MVHTSRAGSSRVLVIIFQNIQRMSKIKNTWVRNDMFNHEAQPCILDDEFDALRDTDIYAVIRRDASKVTGSLSTHARCLPTAVFRSTAKSDRVGVCVRHQCLSPERESILACFSPKFRSVRCSYQRINNQRPLAPPLCRTSAGTYRHLGMSTTATRP